MEAKNKRFTTIDEYIATFREEVQERLQRLRQLIRETVPEAVEAISYQMPTFKLGGKNLIHFAAFKNHIGVYPTPSGVEAFKEELSPYKNAKGSVQFPLNQPLPFNLIKRIVEYRVNEEREKQRR
ncbi:MAG TPA: DUF1801 domain-containing protein [Chloroflexota bacterium]|nr:DUF1801 domain-containing protein [Chloroflexota bacterium]